jgi:signal transduction histidine kinase
MISRPYSSLVVRARAAGVQYVAASVVFVALVGAVDYLTGWELHVSVFYMLVVWYAAWMVGRRGGIAVSATAAVAYFVADHYAGATYSHPLIPYWNATVQLASYTIVTYVVSALRDSQRMQEQLTAFVVHDLRTPLTNAMMGLELIRRSADECLSDRDKKVLRMTTEAEAQMSRLVNTLLDLSRLRHGKMPIEPQAIQVAQLTAEAADMMAPWAEERAVTIAVGAATVGLVARGDPELSQRVLLNLLSNAIKYSPKGTTVTVSAAGDGDGTVGISVTDQGPGIPKEWQERAFDMYAQVQAHRGGAAVGSGLGLTFARMAVEAQGGKIWMDGDAEAGTTVTFTLPAEP